MGVGLLVACVATSLMVLADRTDSAQSGGVLSSTSQTECYVRTFGGRAGEARCHFPYTYKGVTYTECSWLDNDGYPWCYTTPDFSEDDMWAFCQVEVCEACYVPAFGGKSGDARCHFPFTYKGVVYTECSWLDNDGYPWCFTNPSYEQDQIWGFCRDEVCEETTKDIKPPGPSNEILPTSPEECYVTTFGGKAGESRCHFPFVYKGDIYRECSWLDNDGYPWCFTSPDYEQDKMWAFCDEEVCERCRVPTFSGKAGESECVFPFTYKGVVYTECSTVESDGYPWCYTTPTYDQDHSWSFCKEKECDRVSSNELSRRNDFFTR